jgi:hypothetical protein
MSAEKKKKMHFLVWSKALNAFAAVAEEQGFGSTSEFLRHVCKDPPLPETAPRREWTCSLDDATEEALGEIAADWFGGSKSAAVNYLLLEVSGRFD